MRETKIVALCLAFVAAGCSESREMVPTPDAQSTGDDARVPCARGRTCSADEVCILPPGACGAADGGGECRPRPVGCDSEYAPVCGCDGITYGNECDATAAGASLAHTGECESGPGTNCDRRDVRCRAIEPTCPEGQIASVVSACWGPCVPIGECECDDAEQCPLPEQYTCHHHVQRCGPYL